MDFSLSATSRSSCTVVVKHLLDGSLGVMKKTLSCLHMWHCYQAHCQLLNALDVTPLTYQSIPLPKVRSLRQALGDGGIVDLVTF